ncbi:MAG TPA: RHS repeat-associated core domain-containing protein [Thermoanaerobaculia bacterium]|nr:RHS repeat-associated core domain-containing protein [Thermoanaerobaculia bacterium]
MATSRRAFTSGAGTLASYSYGHDAAGNVTAIQDLQNAAFSRTFGYDDLNRLVSANTSGSPWGAGSFVYDAMGNMLSQTLGGNVTTFAYHGSTPKLTSSSTTGQPTESVTYDAAGNEIESKYARTFSVRNLLSERLGPYTSQINGYDGRGVRMISATRNYHGKPGRQFFSAFYQYSPELNLLSRFTESEAENITRVEIVWFAGRPVAQFDTDDQTSTLIYTTTDHLGTPFLQTDDAAQIVWRAEYQPYGTIATMRAGLEDAQPLRFPGQEASLDGAESYNIFRWYRAEWGRYTQADPIGLTGGANLFAYVVGNPLYGTDPLGLTMFPESPFLPQNRAQYCQRLLERIDNLQRKIGERLGELAENPQDLAEAALGDMLIPSLSRRGHRKLIDKDKASRPAKRNIWRDVSAIHGMVFPLAMTSTTGLAFSIANTGRKRLDWPAGRCLRLLTC